DCVRSTCADHPNSCGIFSDGCGGIVNCTCPAGSTCGSNGACSAPPGPCAFFNNGGACTPTEQRFVDKSPDCYNCMANCGCLDDVILGDTGHECGDVTGNAVKGGKTGTARSQLCLDTLDCIMKGTATKPVPPNMSCASTDVTICYCGSLGGGNG